MGARFGICVVVALSSVAPARADVIDRMLAVVGRSLITLSDVAAALRFGLVAPESAAGQDRIRGALDALIARELALAEANRYVPPEPSSPDVDARLEAMRARFVSAAAFDEAMAQSGLTIDRLRQRTRDDLRIRAYLDQRFGPGATPPDDWLDGLRRRIEVIDLYGVVSR